MTTSEHMPPAIHLRYSKAAGEFVLLVPRDIELALAQELRSRDVQPTYQLRETAEVLEQALMMIGGVSGVITIAGAIRAVLGKNPDKRIVISQGDLEIDATNYSGPELEGIIEKLKE